MNKFNNKSSIEKLTLWLDSYLNFERTPKKNIFWLDTMNFLCEKFNNPQNLIPSIHVAGSKGKGSVSIMIASILNEYNKKVGIYTSPHILKFEERVKSFDNFFSEEIYSKSTQEIMDVINSIKQEELPGGRNLTWFEIVTVFAMLCFKNAKVDWSIYEVGLGGRLDSTNVINPVCSVINTIELEHTEFLGNSLEEIAFEKGGIIKKNTPVFIANQNQNVKDVFNKIAKEKNSPIYFVDDYCILLEKAYCNERLKIKFESKLFEKPICANLKMLGDFQVQNAMLASMCVKSILPEIPLEIIESGLEHASLEGRFEICDDLKNYPSLKKIIFDGAHTVKSIQSTIDTLNEIFSTEEKKNLLFACASDKNVSEIAKTFKNKFADVFITIPGKTKESDISSVTKAFDELGIKYISSLDYEKMINFALEKSNEDNALLLITGSFYLISEVKKILNSK